MRAESGKSEVVHIVHTLGEDPVVLVPDWAGSRRFRGSGGARSDARAHRSL